ncbi:MAG: hypothetical protein IJL97_00215 [Lachnospiraceae bacterium]|nr:hypothetical protein [Lachnospiraceae bacterium]
MAGIIKSDFGLSFLKGINIRMANDEKEQLELITKREKQVDALYKAAGTRFGLPDCAMRVLYSLISSETQITQKELIDKMLFPKQTVNSTIATLIKNGFAEQKILPGNRNQKTIMLSENGVKLAHNTVEHLLKAGLAAVENMGEERMKRLIELYSEFFYILKEEFKREGIV